MDWTSGKDLRLLEEYDTSCIIWFDLESQSKDRKHVTEH